MSSILLDKSGWSSEAIGRLAALADEKAAVAARSRAAADHVFAGALGQASDASLAVSSETRYRLKARDFGNGHKELVICKETPDLEKRLERAIARDLGAFPLPASSEDVESNRERAVRRAKQGVRHLAKAMIVNSLWTLTYRENVQDRALVLKHLDLFRRRVGVVLGELRYIAVLEKQERGAWHIHIATHELPKTFLVRGTRVKSWDLMRSIWRHIVGSLGGNFDEAKRRARWGDGRLKPIRGAGAIARYIAGYVAKDMHDSEAFKKRYSHSRGTDIPAAFVALWPAHHITMRELLQLAYSFIGERVTSSWFDAERGLFFIESDDTRGLG